MKSFVGSGGGEDITIIIEDLKIKLNSENKSFGNDSQLALFGQKIGFGLCELEIWDKLET